MSLEKTKNKLYHNIWCCAYQRRFMYQGTPREEREHDTVLMCLNIITPSWWSYDNEKKRSS